MKIEVGCRVFTYMKRGESFNRLYGKVVGDRGIGLKNRWIVLLDKRNVEVWFNEDELRVLKNQKTGER